MELEAGIGFLHKPMYRHADPIAYEVQSQERLIGRVVLTHTFNVFKSFGLKVYAEHNSLLLEGEPQVTADEENYGMNLIGSSVVYKF